MTNAITDLIGSKTDDEIALTGEQTLSLSEILAVARFRTPVTFSLSKSIKERISLIHGKMIDQVENGVPIYGVTSSYGGQSSRLLMNSGENAYLSRSKALSSAIVHVDVSTGPIVSDEITRAAMLLRINMLLPGYSAVRLETLDLLKNLLNSEYVPQVGQYGSLGASGDLAQNGRIISTLLQNPTAKVKNSNNDVLPSTVLQEIGMKPLKLDPKEGLGLVNGDNFSTASAAVITWDLIHLFILNLAISAMTIQALKGSIRNFHPILSHIRPHEGQGMVAKMLRAFLINSKLAPQELQSLQTRPVGEEIQDPYSIRCLPQFYGPDFETLMQAWEMIEINANSVSDNPVWTTPEHTVTGEEPYQWVSGGNFLAMYMAEIMDRLRKVAVHMVKQNDRHLARLVHPYLSRGLPANLSNPDSISQCVFKGLQTQMGMYDTYAGLLAAPVSTAFGLHEELNQDITSHGMTSAKMTHDAMQLAKYAIATNWIAAAQAIDLRGGREMLSGSTKPVYDKIRTLVPFVEGEQPLGHFVEEVSKVLIDRELVVNLLHEIDSYEE